MTEKQNREVPFVSKGFIVPRNNRMRRPVCHVTTQSLQSGNVFVYSFIVNIAEFNISIQTI